MAELKRLEKANTGRKGKKTKIGFVRLIKSSAWQDRADGRKEKAKKAIIIAWTG
jgi:hypothetical protein